MKSILLKRSSTTAALTCLGVMGMLALSQSHAQNVSNFEDTQTAPATNIYMVTGGLTYRSTADIDEGGEFSAVGLRAGVGGLWAFNERVMLQSGFNYEYTSYDFSEMPVDLWDDINTFRFRGILAYVVDQNWRVYGGPILTFSGENGADFSHSFSGGAVTGVKYNVSDELSVGLVMGLFSRIEDDPAFFLFPTLDWRFMEQYILTLGYANLGSSGGLGVELGYDMTEQWRFSLGAQYQKQRFLLDEDRRAPFGEGVGQDESIPIYVKATWRVTPQFFVEGHVGITAGGELRVENKDGHKLGESDYDPSAQLGIRAGVTF